MAISEMIPSWPGLPDPSGPVLPNKSLRGRQYRLRSKDHTSFDLESILRARGIEERESFLRPNLRRDMPDPMSLANMDKASKRIAQAVTRQEKVLIFGDYDVDGACASAIFVRWFAGLGQQVDVYIPDRFADGYGPSVPALKKAKADTYDLVIFVDCGTAAREVIDAMQSDVVIVDHHLPQGVVPSVIALVNPHLQDDFSGLGMLCAGALCFMAVVATQAVLKDDGYFGEASPPNLKYLLELVALCSVADVVPLVGPGRLFTAKGLEVMRTSPSPAISALMRVASVEDISAGRIGFALGPRINAGGRVGGGSSEVDGALGVRLLTSTDEHEVNDIAERLNKMNAKRQAVEADCISEAMDAAEIQDAMGQPIIAVYGNDWHPGVVGIVAGRIKERFDKPTIVAAMVEGLLSGSGRSVPGFNLGDVIVEAKGKGLLVGGGGHAMACGLKCDPAKWNEFMAFLQDRETIELTPIEIDARATAASLGQYAIDDMELLQPLGQGMPNIRLAIEKFRITASRYFGKGHLRLECGPGLEAIIWNAEKDAYYEDRLDGAVVTLIGTPKMNHFRGVTKISIDVQDIIE